MPGIHRGVWRIATIRSSARTGQVMIIVIHAAPEGAAGARECGSDSYGRDVFEKEKERLVSMLTKDCIPMPDRTLPDLPMAEDEKDIVAKDNTTAAADKSATASIPFKVSSIFFQEYNGLSHPTPNDPVQHVYGEKHILDILGKNTFQISPGAFFQVTTVGAEVLYDEVADRVREVSENPADTLLLDVCCGTGTIGLHCMKEGVAGRVLGVDISEPAIEDAKANAVRNGYGDEGVTRFVASRAELVLAEELQKPGVKGKPIVAVVDPAREGLHADVIRALRYSPQIRRLVYVSCNPTGSLTNDAASLCQLPTKKYKGLPFKPTLAQPVDMFPLTSHCELVITFDRMTEEEYAALIASAPSTGSEKKKNDVADAKDADPETVPKEKTETAVQGESKSEVKIEPNSGSAAVNEAATLTDEVMVKEGKDTDVKMELAEEIKSEDV